MILSTREDPSHRISNSTACKDPGISWTITESDSPNASISFKPTRIERGMLPSTFNSRSRSHSCVNSRLVEGSMPGTLDEPELEEEETAIPAQGKCKRRARYVDLSKHPCFGESGNKSEHHIVIGLDVNCERLGF